MKFTRTFDGKKTREKLFRVKHVRSYYQAVNPPRAHVRKDNIKPIVLGY